MLNTLLPVGLLILVPAWEQFRRARPFMLFALVAATYLVFAGLAVVIFRSPLILNWLTTPVTTSGTYHDTYYVVSHAEFSLSLALVFAIIALITWAQTKAGALYYRRLTIFAFWGLHLSVLSSSLVQFVMQTTLLRRNVEYDEAFQGITLISNLTGFAAFLFLCMLAILLLLSVLRRISKRSNH